jgi:hypothetical protein
MDAYRIIGYLKTGEAVVNAGSRIDLLPDVFDEAIGKINGTGRPVIIGVVKFDHVVGLTNLVPTCDGDQIVFAQCKGAAGMTRYVHGRKPEPCDTVVIILAALQKRTDCYRVVRAFIGPKPEPEFWDDHSHVLDEEREIEESRQASLDFWGGPSGPGHAWIYNATEVA